MTVYLLFLQMPTVEYKSNIKPSTFAYPPPLELAKKEEKERVATAILSVTAKAKRREADKVKGGDKSEPMEIEEDTKKKEEVEKEKEEEPKEKEVKKEEPSFEILKNPARVMKQQVQNDSSVPFLSPADLEIFLTCVDNF